MLPPPTDAQTRTESRSGEETGKEKSGCFKLFTVVQTRRWSWSSPAGSRAEAPGSARRGAPGRRAPARCGPSRGSHRRDAYFSQSRCRRGDPAPAKEAPDPRSAEAFASDARRAAASLSPRPATVTPNFGQRRPGSVPGTSQVRSGRRSCRRLPLPPTRLAICSLGLPGLNREPKVGSLLRWEQLCQPPRRLRVLRARAARSPALSSLAEPSRGSLFSEAAFFPRLGSTATDPQESAAAASVWQRQRPRALQPLRYRFPRSASGKPLVSWAPLRPAGRPGLPAPNPLRFLLARCRAAGSPAETARRRAHRVACPGPALGLAGGAWRSLHTPRGPSVRVKGNSRH